MAARRSAGQGVGQIEHGDEDLACALWIWQMPRGPVVATRWSSCALDLEPSAGCCEEAAERICPGYPLALFIGDDG